MRKTTKKEKPFSRLNAAEKRVAIAQDVLAQLKIGRYVAESGTYVSLVDGDDTKVKANQQFLTKPPQFGASGQCNVCAKGALVCSIVRLDKKFNKTVLQLASDVNLVLRRFFGQENANVMEAAFENWNEFDDADGSDATQAFWQKHHDGDDRSVLEAIMKNVIKNKGEFKP